MSRSSPSSRRCASGMRRRAFGRPRGRPPRRATRARSSVELDARSPRAVGQQLDAARRASRQPHAWSPRRRAPRAPRASRSAARSASAPARHRRPARARRGSDRPARGGSRGSRRARRAPSPCSLQPVGEALVELGPGRLRQRVVGGVTDQDVPEAVGVVARELRRSPAGRAPCGRAREPPSRPVSAPSACTAPRWNTCPSTAPRSSTLRSSPSSWSSRAASSAWTVGGTTTSPPPLRRPSRPSPRRRADFRRPRRGSSRRAQRRSCRRACAISSSVSSGESGSSRTVVAFSSPPPQPAAGRAAPGRPRQRSRIGAPAAHGRGVLDEVEERRLAPVDVVEDHEQRRRPRRLPRAVGETRSAISSDEVGVPLADERRRAGRAARRRGRASPSWRTISVTGQYVIPSP